MKILKDAEYERLLAFEERYNNLYALHESNLDDMLKLEQHLDDEITRNKKRLLNVVIRRMFVGKKGSGKTELVKSFLYQLHPNTYFVIDPNNEYLSIPVENKYTTMRVEMNSEGLRNKLVSIVKEQAENGKLIVLEDASLFGKLNWFFEAIGKSNFIIVAHTSKILTSEQLSLVDVIYNTGCFETKQHEKVQKLYPDIYFDMSKEQVQEQIKNNYFFQPVK